MFNTKKFGTAIRVEMAVDSENYRSASYAIQGANGADPGSREEGHLVPSSTLCKLAKGGKVVPTTIKLVAICVWLDVDPREFWYGWDRQSDFLGR